MPLAADAIFAQKSSSWIVSVAGRGMTCGFGDRHHISPLFLFCLVILYTKMYLSPLVLVIRRVTMIKMQDVWQEPQYS